MANARTYCLAIILAPSLENRENRHARIMAMDTLKEYKLTACHNRSTDHYVMAYHETVKITVIQNIHLEI